MLTSLNQPPPWSSCGHDVVVRDLLESEAVPQVNGMVWGRAWNQLLESVWEGGYRETGRNIWATLLEDAGE